jgi:hypothetical protein
MSRATVIANDRVYTIAPDDGPLLGERSWAIISGRLVDEVSGEAPAAPPQVTPLQAGIEVRVAADGAFALVARPFVRFLRLGAPAYSVDFFIAVKDFLPMSLRAGVSMSQRQIAAPAPAIGATLMTLNNTAGLHAGQTLLIGPMGPTQETALLANLVPASNQLTLTAGLQHAHGVGDPVVTDEFSPLELGAILLHREPVTIRGRAFRRDVVSNTSVPVANAKIAVQGFWRMLSEVRQHLPAHPPSLVALAPGLYAARATGATLVVLDLPPVSGDDKLLLADVSAGASSIRLSNIIGIAINTILLLDSGQPDKVEYLRVSVIEAGVGVGEAATIGFDFPLRFAHRAGARVQRVIPQAPGAGKTVTVDAAIGDSTAFLSNVAGLATAMTVRIADGVQPDEYQRVRTYEVASDAAGYFQLPEITRIAQLRVQASAPAMTALTIDVQPDYTERGNWLDIGFPT